MSGTSRSSKRVNNLTSLTPASARRLTRPASFWYVALRSIASGTTLFAFYVVVCKRVWCVCGGGGVDVVLTTMLTTIAVQDAISIFKRIPWQTFKTKT